MSSKGTYDAVIIDAGVIVRFVIIVSKVKRFSIMRFLSERFLFSALAAPTPVIFSFLY